MIRQIDTAQLRPGMYVHKLGGSWLEHPFLRNSFALGDARAIDEIHASGIEVVWIDTEKGLDLEGAAPAGAAAPASRAALPPSARPPPARRVAMAEELERAASICRRSTQAVVSMFEDARMGKAIEAASMAPLVREIAQSVARNPGALISIARLKTADDYTYMHSVAVCALMIALAHELGLEETAVREAGLAGLLHDVGKIAVPVEILNKPGKLTDSEFDIVKGHPESGHRMLLEGSGVGETALDVCLHHHERVDGSGYPHRLKGEEITRFAKMGAVCDVYDAITSDRPYKKGWDPAEAISKMAEWSTGHFDAPVFQAFAKCIGIYPVGSLVRLASGRLGVVLEQSTGSLLKPRVRVFFSTRSQMRIAPEIVDLARAGTRDTIAGREDPERWNFRDLNDLWRRHDPA